MKCKRSSLVSKWRVRCRSHCTVPRLFLFMFPLTVRILVSRSSTPCFPNCTAVAPCDPRRRFSMRVNLSSSTRGIHNITHTRPINQRTNNERSKYHPTIRYRFDVMSRESEETTDYTTNNGASIKRDHRTWSRPSGTEN